MLLHILSVILSSLFSTTDMWGSHVSVIFNLTSPLLKPQTSTACPTGGRTSSAARWAKVALRPLQLELAEPPALRPPQPELVGIPSWPSRCRRRAPQPPRS
jgi:hypothetical protein